MLAKFTQYQRKKGLRLLTLTAHFRSWYRDIFPSIQLEINLNHIRLYHDFVDRMNNSVPRVIAWHHEAS